VTEYYNGIIITQKKVKEVPNRNLGALFLTKLFLFAIWQVENLRNKNFQINLRKSRKYVGAR